MAKRIYLVTHDGIRRLVKANSRVAARDFVARTTIQVELPTMVEVYELGRDGVTVIEAKLKSKPVSARQLAHMANMRAVLVAKHAAKAMPVKVSA